MAKFIVVTEGFTFGGFMPSFDPHHASSTTAQHLQGGLFPYCNAIFYAVCVTALVFHFANGLWTAAITWGLTVTTTAQHRWGMACAAIGAGLAAAGLTAILGFTFLDVGEAEAVEQEMLAA